MGALDQLQAAGFSPQEMAGYAQQKHAALSAGGFSDQEIASYLGGTMGPAAPHPDTAEANRSFAQAVGNSVVDIHNLMNVGTGKDAAQTMMDIGTVYAPLEAALNAATGVMLGFTGYVAAGAIGGVDRYVLGNKQMDPNAFADKIANALTYQPHTAVGARLTGAAQFPWELLMNAGMAAGKKVADVGEQAGLSNNTALVAGDTVNTAIQLLPAILLGELGRKMGGQRITSTDMTNVAKVVAGPDAAPDAVATVEKSLRSTYAQTGIGPYSVLEQSRMHPDIDADLKNPDVDIPTALQQYARRSQIGVPVSEQMKAVRPLEAETPPPAPVPLEITPEASESAGVSASSDVPVGEQEGAGAASNPMNLESSAPVRTNTQLSDALQDALKQHDIDRAYQLYEQKIDNERNFIGNIADAENLFAEYQKEDSDAITLMHSGLNPAEAIQGLKNLSGKILQTDVGQKTAAVAEDALRDVQLKATPMAAGSERAQAIAKDAANAMRKAAWQWSAFDDLLKKGYTKEQREKMWNAAEEENTLRTQGITDSSRGLGSLTDDERQTVETLSQYGNSLLARAKQVGMFQGDGVPYWTPRMVTMIGEDGEVSLPPRTGEAEFAKQGGNITTTAGSLKGRKHATVEETEAAARAKFGEGATVVRDIRTMPMAMARIERAIAGRELVNRIKDIGLQIGQETVTTGEKPGFFTIDHPAFKTYRVAGDRWVKASEAELTAKNYVAGNGQVWKSNPNTVSEYDPVSGYRVAADGSIERREPIMERAPLYVSKEFEGPLKAIMTEKSGPLYKALMSFKGKVMSMIMYSPLIHNAVEWGRALPMMPGKVLTGRIYFEGNAAKHDPITMRRAIDSGLVPIGHRFFGQDITGLLEEPNIKPGRSLTAKALGGAVGLVDKGTGDALKSAIDRAGDVWHNTLLWDRVADLQMGLYTNLERDMIQKGIDPQTSSRLAAHFANRYAGALPNEAMSAGARKLANLTLFSRTFTLGNIGAMKDMVTGLPQDVQAQILRDAGEVARVGAMKAGRQKAIHAFVMDVGLMYVGNAIMQNVMDTLMRDKTLPQILHGYAMRFKDYLTRADTDPSALLDLGSLFPTAANEPGKENRIFFNTAPDGTAIYMRLPTGKIGEEFQGYLTSPLEMLKRKQGTLMRPLLQTIENDKGFGRKVYDDQEPGLPGMLHAVGNVVWNVLQQQIPMDSIQAGYRLFSGHPEDTDALKVVGPLLGITFSKGAPGGPEVGVMFQAERHHQDEVASAMPDIKEHIKQGDIQGAIEKMDAAHMTPEEQRLTLKYTLNPQARLNRNRLRKFQQIAPAELLQKMEEMQQERVSNDSNQP